MTSESLSIWARHWAALQGGQLRTKAPLPGIMHIMDLGHALGFCPPEPPDGPFNLTEEEVENLTSDPPVPVKQPTYPPIQGVPPMQPVPPNGKVDIDGRVITTTKYVGGQEWVDEVILPVDSQTPINVPADFRAQPHPWQLEGAAQIQFLCQSRFRGALCGDAMGLGKILQAILAIDLARPERGCFSLVLCPASCREQWRSEIESAYMIGRTPKTIVLDDRNTTLHELLQDQYEVVIVSFQFLAEQHKRLIATPRRFYDYREGTNDQPPIFPTCPFYDGALRALDLPIKRLVVDECQHLKRENGSIFNACAAVYRTATILLSGTMIDNRWPDITNAVSLLKGHPINNRRRFMAAFEHNKGIPRQNLLQRFLLGIMIARSSDTFILPGLHSSDITFELGDHDRKRVQKLMKKYQAAIAFRAERLARGEGTADDVQALGYSVEAQLVASHPFIIENRPSLPELSISETEIQADVDGVVAMLTAHEDSVTEHSRENWLQRLQATPLDILKAPPRMQAFVKLWKEVRQQYPNDKVIIFSRYRKLLDIVYQILSRESNRGGYPLQYHGLMAAKEKIRAEQAFRATGAGVPLLITAQSGGTGLNIQSASVVIQMEVWWNKNSEQQAIARCYRYGQEKEVKYFRLYASNSEVDKVINTTRGEKAKINDAIMSGIWRRHDQPVHVPEAEDIMDMD